MTPNCSQTDAWPDLVSGRPLHRLRVSLALLCLALLGLAQTGCRSDGCSTCGGFGSRLTSGVQSLNARIFNHSKSGGAGGCSTCGTLGTVEEGTVYESGTPVSSGVIAVPAPATIVPSPPAEAPSQLEAIPSTSGASNRSTSGIKSSAYEAATNRGTAVASHRGSDLSRAYQPATTPTQTNFTPEEPDVFDNLPPVALPSELSRKVVPTAKEPDPAPSTAPPAIIPPVQTSLKGASAEFNSAEDRLVLPTTPAATTITRLAPGIARSTSVAPLLTGGSLPTAEGIAWLKEKGYRTLVDLNSRSDVDPNFPDLVTDGGLLYIPLAFALDPISLNRLARFNDLIAQNDQRPLYFCDTDGRRAGLIWYLRLRSRDHEDSDSARLKAEELGFQRIDIAAAEKFLKLNFALDLPPVAPALTVAPLPVESVVCVRAILPAQVQTPVVVTETPDSPIEEVRARRVAQAVSFVPVGQGASWKPITALVLSGLGVPLAYWSGSSLFQKRGPRRASLVAKGQGPRKSLPSSGA